jgi:hypothetical protein
MFAISLGDGAELRPLEPWRAEEFLAHMDRGREYIGRRLGLPDFAADLDSARSWLKSYADKTAADAGRLYGIWLDGLGMSRDGVLRESYPYRGVRHDSEVWSVLAPEWRAAHSAR